MLKKITLTFVLLLNVNCFANTLQIGQEISPFKLVNQHGKVVTVDSRARILLFTKGKVPSNLLNDFLLKQSRNFLSKKQAYFVADISAMPFLIGKMLAIPKLRKMGHEILLVKEEATLSFVPHKKGFITVIKKKDGKIQTIDFVNTMTAVEKIFK